MSRVVVIGAGAAGFFAALAARGAIGPDGMPRRALPEAPDVLLLDGQAQPGRKILIAGGGRCNVTNEVVTERDFWTEHPRLVRNALRAFGADEARQFFEGAGVPLKVEPLGKVFPQSDRARDVLDTLLRHADAAGVVMAFGSPVDRVVPDGDTWLVNDERADRVVLATGGLSVPATGSTGFGLDLAARLGHRVVPTVPALAAVVADGTEALAGLTVPAVVSAGATRAAGSLLFTHKGISGPAALDVSGAVEFGLAKADPDVSRVRLDLWSLTDREGPFGPHLDDAKLPGCCLRDAPAAATARDVDRQLADLADANPRTTVEVALGDRLPRRLATFVAGPHASTPLGQLRRQDRTDLASRLADWTLPASATGGYPSAEVTRGGVALDELDRVTLESRIAPGLHLCGEVVDVTGRLGGFNFQWAWTSGWLAGTGARTLAP